MGYRYIFKGTYEKKFQTGEDMAKDEIEKHRKGRVVSSFDAIWRELGFPMFVCEPQVKDATLHELKVLAQESRTRDGASDFAKYVFRPIEVDRFLGRTDDNPVTMTEFHEMFEAVLRPPASVTRYMRQHGLATAEAIPTAAWSNMKTADGRNIFFSSLPRFGAPAVFYYRRQHDRVFRLTRERFGTEGWYRRALAGIVGVRPQIDARVGDASRALESLRTVHGVVHESYEAAARARNLIRQEDEAEYAMKEAVDNSDTPNQLLMLLVSLVLTKHACLTILTHDTDRCKSIRSALTADADDVRDDAERKEVTLQRLDEALRRNDKLLRTFGLPEPMNRSKRRELKRELKYWERRRELLSVRTGEVIVIVQRRLLVDALTYVCVMPRWKRRMMCRWKIELEAGFTCLRSKQKLVALSSRMRKQRLVGARGTLRRCSSKALVGLAKRS